jgi:hypothetical protein
LTLKDQIASDLGAIYNTDEFGETVTYDPAAVGVAAFSCVVLFSDSGIDITEDRIYHDSARCRILQEDLTVGGVTDPTPARNNQTGDTITRNGVVWTVIDPIEQDSFSGEWIVTLEKDVRFVP